MARQVVVIGLVLFVVVGMAFAESAKDSAAPPVELDGGAEEETDNSIIGTSDDSVQSPHGLLGAPIGGPVPPGAFAAAVSRPPPNAASAVHVSAIGGAAATALAGFFYF